MHRRLEGAQEALRRCAGALTIDQLTEKPAPGKWTIAEILEHLTRAFAGTAEGARRTVAGGRPTARVPDLGSRFRTFVVVECGYLPPGRNAPKMTLPRGADPATVFADAIRALQEMDDALAAAAAKFGSRVRLMDHPIIGPLSVRQWRRFHWVHTRHHARQIERRVAGLSGPSA
jgi:hypothetical protein